MRACERWLALEWKTLDADLQLTRCEDGVCKTRVVPAARWSVLWDRYVDAADAARQYGFSTFDRRLAQRLREAQKSLEESAANIYVELKDAIGSLHGGEPTFRSPLLARLPLAMVVAAGRKDWLEANRLPFDLHPHFEPVNASRHVEAMRAWEFPSVRELTILVARDLSESRIVTDPENMNALALTTIVQWRIDLRLALQAAQERGARVVSPLCVEDVIRALDGEYGPHVQIIAHLDEQHRLQCDDGWLSMPKALQEVEAALRMGWRSSLKSADLSFCLSASVAADVFLSAGIGQVSTRHDELHVGELAHFLRRIYERELLDGTRPAAHAWLRAGLT